MIDCCFLYILFPVLLLSVINFNMSHRSNKILFYNHIEVRVFFSFSPFMPSGFFYHYPLDRSISNRRGVMFYKIPVFNANSVDPDQTLRSAASDLRLYYLPMSLLWDTKLKWVKHNCPACIRK